MKRLLLLLPLLLLGCANQVGQVEVIHTRMGDKAAIRHWRASTYFVISTNRMYVVEFSSGTTVIDTVEEIFSGKIIE